MMTVMMNTGFRKLLKQNINDKIYKKDDNVSIYTSCIKYFTNLYLNLFFVSVQIILFTVIFFSLYNKFKYITVLNLVLELLMRYLVYLTITYNRIWILIYPKYALLVILSITT